MTREIITEMTDDEFPGRSKQVPRKRVYRNTPAHFELSDRERAELEYLRRRDENGQD